MWREIPLTSRWYQHRVKAFTSERCLNLYPEAVASDNGAGARSEFILLGTPGLTLFSDTGQSKGMRGFHTRLKDGTPFAVIGQTVYSIAEDGTPTALTGSVDGEALVTMADNGNQVAICNGSSLYVVNGSNVLAVTDPDFPGAATIDILDGYGLFPKPGSDQFYITALYDFTDIDALDFASAERKIDKLLLTRVLGEYIYQFGGSTIEQWYNSGASSFPIERVPGSVIAIGLGAVHSVSELDSTLFFLASDGTVRRLSGTETPKRVSNHPLEDVISRRGYFHDAEAFSYVQAGHSFYVLTLPGTGTYSFDVATGLWQERGSIGEQRLRLRGYANAYGKHLVGDCKTGKIYQLNQEAYTENGAMVEREIVLPPITAKGDSGNLHGIEVVFGAGTGLLSGQGSDPKAMLSVSKDGGHTWGPERWASIGRRGEYRNRARWKRFGRFDGTLMLKLRVTDPVELSIIGVYADM